LEVVKVLWFRKNYILIIHFRLLGSAYMCTSQGEEAVQSKLIALG
jgi:hypothetical protein